MPVGEYLFLMVAGDTWAKSYRVVLLTNERRWIVVWS